MKIKIIQYMAMITFSGILMSCAMTSPFSPGSGNKYRYTFKMVYPVKNSKLLFQDDSVIIQFKFDDAAIQFQLQNISLSNITLDWDKASIGIKDRYFGVPACQYFIQRYSPFKFHYHASTGISSRRGHSA